MTPQQIKANAPDGATHYLMHIHSLFYCKMKGNRMYAHGPHGWYELYGNLNLKPL